MMNDVDKSSVPAKLSVGWKIHLHSCWEIEGTTEHMEEHLPKPEGGQVDCLEEVQICWYV
jgi:hypothetical protein